MFVGPWLNWRMVAYERAEVKRAAMLSWLATTAGWQVHCGSFSPQLVVEGHGEKVDGFGHGSVLGDSTTEEN